MRRLLGSASVRIALSYAAGICIVALTLLGFLWWRTTGFLDREITAVIIADTRAVGDRLSDFGLSGAIESINERINKTSDPNAVYLLTDPAKHPVVGNLRAWPVQVGLKPGWYNVSLVRGNTLHQTRILNVVLGDGFHLLVGRDVQERTALKKLIVGSLTWTAVIALLLATAGGLLVRYSILKHVGALNVTTAAIVRGDLSRRLETPPSGDEFEQLARTINGMLDQIQLLVEGARNSSNAIAHDLRTPLSELRTRLEAIVRDRPETEQALDQVEAAVADTDRIIETFNALLRLADIRSGARRTGFHAVDLGQVTADVVELYTPMAEANNLAFAVDAPLGLTIQGDPHLLAQALSNLVDNAIKFSPDGSVIRVSARPIEGGFLEMRVADRGPGIPETDKRLVGHTFERGSGHERTPGSGLGLSIVEAIARLHGGHLDLRDNDPGLVAAVVLRSNASEAPAAPSTER